MRLKKTLRFSRLFILFFIFSAINVQGVFSGMSYNIFKDEKKLITKAGVRDVTF